MKIFTDVPSFEGDPNQSLFNKALDSVVSEAAKEQYSLSTTNTTQGFPASYINLNWIKNKISSFWQKNPDISVDELAEIIKEEFDYVVQRLKMLRVSPKDDSVELEFRTKDDLGYYSYNFYMHLSQRRLKVIK